jgi:hypothetical protein
MMRPWHDIVEKKNKIVVGEDFLLAQNEWRRGTLHLHLCEVSKYQIITQKEVWAV